MDSYMDTIIRQSDQQSGSDAEEDLVDYSDVIERNHLLLVTSLQLDRYFLFSFLRSKGILDEEDVELVTCSGTTRQQRVSRFLDLIRRKGIHGMQCFVYALQFENPALYEKLSGKKANSSPPAISSSANLSAADVRNKSRSLNDIDYDVLAKQLAHSAEDMQCLTGIHQKVLEEKQVHEKKLMKANNDLKLKEEEIQFYKKINDSLKKQSKENTQGTSATNTSKLLNQLIQKDHLVNVLQGKLLTLMDEMEGLRKDNQKHKNKNNELSRENIDLQFYYNSEKRQSVVLKERVKDHEYDVSHVNKLKVEMKQNLTDMISLREENIELKKELEEFSKYGDVLKEKYKFLVKEKTVICQRQRNLSSSNVFAQEQLAGVMKTNSMLQLEKDHLQLTNKRLNSDVNVALELHSSVQEEYKKSCDERQKLCKSLEEAKQEKVHAEQNAQYQMSLNMELNRKYLNVCKELDELRVSYQNLNEVLLNKDSTYEERGQYSSLPNDFNSIVFQEENVSKEENDSLEYLDIANGAEYFRKKRTSTAVLKSIKRYVDIDIDRNKLMAQKSFSVEDLTTLWTLDDKQKATTLPPNINISMSRYMSDMGCSEDDSSDNVDGWYLHNANSIEESDVPTINLENQFDEEVSPFRERVLLYDKSKGKSKEKIKRIKRPLSKTSV